MLSVLFEIDLIYNEARILKKTAFLLPILAWLFSNEGIDLALFRVQ